MNSNVDAGTWRASVREYVAILSQQLGMHRVARRLRRQQPLAAMVRWHDDPPAPVPGATVMFNPYIVDTPTERLLQFSGDALQTRMQLDQPDALLAAYTRQMMSFLLFNPDPQRIVMIGLGGGSLAKFCFRRLPRAQIAAVEIDEQVIAMRDAFFIPPDDARFHVVHDDGTRYVSRLACPVDAILIDAFDDLGVSQEFASCNFFESVRDRLAPGGVMIMNLYGDPARYRAHIEHARAVFGSRMLVVSVTANDNLLLCAFGGAAVSPVARQLDLRANYLQATLRLNFRVYLQRFRESVQVQRDPEHAR